MLPSKAYSGKTKTGHTGIFDNDKLALAKKLESHLGRFVKVELKDSGLRLERKIDYPFIKAVQLGMFNVLTYLE